MSPPTWGDRWRALFGRDPEPRHSTETVVEHEIVDSIGPFEPPAGQDDPPDLLLAILATLTLLADIRDRLDRERDAHAADLKLRISALAAVLVRLRNMQGH